MYQIVTIEGKFFLSLIRENQIRIEFTMQPIEESYAALNKYNLVFNDGNAERVDSLSYGWKKVTTQVSDTFTTKASFI